MIDLKGDARPYLYEDIGRCACCRMAKSCYWELFSLEYDERYPLDAYESANRYTDGPCWGAFDTFF